MSRSIHAEGKTTLRDSNSTSQQKQTDSDDAEDDQEWEEAVDDVRDEADLPSSKGTLTIKTIDGRDYYYYLQWREGSEIKSQYVTPVVPANS